LSPSQASSLSLSLALPLLSYHIANAYNNPLTLFFFFLSSSRLSSPWDAAVVSLPGLPAETLDQLHPPPLHCRTLTLPHTLCKRSSTGGPRPPGGSRRYCRGSAK